MLDHSSKSKLVASLPEPAASAGESPVADPLSEMLRGLRLDGVEYGRCRFSAPWATAFPPESAARFHLVGSGGCVISLSDGRFLPLAPGDAVLLPHGPAHVIGSGPDVPPKPFQRLGRREVCSGVFDLQSNCAAGGDVMFTGAMCFNLDRQHPLMEMMPPMMLASALSATDPAIPHLLDAMAREVEMNRVGAAGILARLADVLTATLIRAWVEHGCGATSGWLAAVRSPDVGKVLAAIHLEPARDWTVAELARLMGASRSGFAARFSDVVGETPARYVARVRMHQARLWLSDGMRVSTAAERLGYDAEASFSRAFKRVIGAPPSAFRKTA